MKTLDPNYCKFDNLICDRCIDSDNWNWTDNNCYIYLLKCEERYKIGISGEVLGRAKNLDQNSAFDVVYISSKLLCCENFASKVEDYLHCKYDDCRIKGEWFLLSKSEIKEVLGLFEHPNNMAYSNIVENSYLPRDIHEWGILIYYLDQFRLFKSARQKRNIQFALGSNRKELSFSSVVKKFSAGELLSIKISQEDSKEDISLLGLSQIGESLCRNEVYRPIKADLVIAKEYSECYYKDHSNRKDHESNEHTINSGDLSSKLLWFKPTKFWSNGKLVYHSSLTLSYFDFCTKCTLQNNLEFRYKDEDLEFLGSLFKHRDKLIKEYNQSVSDLADKVAEAAIEVVQSWSEEELDTYLLSHNRQISRFVTN